MTFPDSDTACRGEKSTASIAFKTTFPFVDKLKKERDGKNNLSGRKRKKASCAPKKGSERARGVNHRGDDACSGERNVGVDKKREGPSRRSMSDGRQPMEGQKNSVARRVKRGPTARTSRRASELRPRRRGGEITSRRESRAFPQAKGVVGGVDVERYRKGKPLNREEGREGRQKRSPPPQRV